MSLTGALAPFVLGFFFAAAFGKILIPYLVRLKVGQKIREEGPKSHQKKAGTPTIGGIIFILAILISQVIYHAVFSVPYSTDEILVLGLMMTYGLTGFIDDYRKVRLGRSLGLLAREKMALQVLFAAVFMWFFVDRGSRVIVPFTGAYWDLGVLYSVFGVFVIVGTGNAVNLTDGLDGLASGVVAIGLVAYYFIAVEYSRVFSPGSALRGIPALALSAAGSLGGFLLYNYHPARVFMGDTGSLALGGLLAGLAIATRTELVLPFIAAVPLAETVSVILQVASFQLFGKRIFKMTPLHHHFELLGWKETKVVMAFWVASLVFAILGIISMAYV